MNRIYQFQDPPGTTHGTSHDINEQSLTIRACGHLNENLHDGNDLGRAEHPSEVALSPDFSTGPSYLSAILCSSHRFSHWKRLKKFVQWACLKSLEQDSKNLQKT
jgi:hypothetical protein